MRRRWQHPAFTLIETLVVVLLLAMVSTAVVTSVSAPAERARFDGAVRAVLELDAIGRAEAQRTGPISLSSQPAELLLRNADDDVVFSREVGTAIVHIETQLDGDIVEINTLGRSDDYIVTVTLGPLTERWAVAGLTGWVERDDSEDAP